MRQTKKLIKLNLLILILLFCGCGMNIEKTQESISNDLGNEKIEQSEELLQSEQMDLPETSIVQGQISMEDIIRLSEKENLTVEDVTEWSDIQSMGTNDFYYEFSYEGVPYRLDIIEDSDGSLASVRLVDMNTYLSIDIRTGSIDNLLANVVSVSDYLTISLPDGWTVGDYDIYLGGHFGGSQILDKQGNSVGDILIMHGLNPAFSSNELIDIGNYDNNVCFLEKEALTQIYVPCILTLMSEESEGVKREYRCAYFAQEGCDIYYQIKVNSDYISGEEMIDLLETVVFTERAFY
ncbi:MAG: hypothetical protein IJ405_07950 [Lachnospiraceae bacterium]|nr:hypothetical protein [Lachnospiraceae bacterium]MBQ7781936.1 hypothetical protein [Lachnospiraceae bacterium]